MTAYVLMAAYSCVFAFRKLTRPGMSAEIRYVFIRKHITYVIVFIIIWLTYLCYTYFNLKYAYISNWTDPKNKDHKEIENYEDLYNLRRDLLYISLFTAMITGTIMTIIRTREPYFKFLIKQQWMAFFGELMEEKDI